MRNGQETMSQVLPRLSTMTSQPSEQRPSSGPAGVAPVCETCGGVGFYRLDVPPSDYRFGKLQRCPCKAQEDAERLQRLSGLTQAERAVRLAHIVTQDRPDTTNMLLACAKFLDHPQGFLTIYGTSGNAKTAALQACVNELLSVGVEAVYVTAFDLISHIREAFDNTGEVKGQSAYERLLRFASVPFLAIDELDKVRRTGWVDEQLTDLIDRRYRLGVSGEVGTVVAMNAAPSEVLPYWIVSRMSEGEIIVNNDSDLRSHLKG